MMIKAIKILIVLTCFSIICKGDVPKIDIITLLLNEEIYYITLAEIGYFKNNDLCYYDFKGEFIENVSESVERKLKRKEVTLYKKLDIVELKNVAKNEEFKKTNYETRLYKLSDAIEIRGETIKKFRVISAIQGNTSGYIYTKELNELDNHWLTEYEIEYICPMYFSNCEGSLYGIKYNVDEKEKLDIKKKLENIARDNKDVYPFLSELYKRNIIMIGACSC